MKPINCLINKTTDSQMGDCDRACLASILELTSFTVPHFFDYAPSLGGQPGVNLKRDWLQQFNLDYVEFPVLVSSVDDALDFCGHFLSSQYVMLIGVSDKGMGHCVVAHKGKIVHNPSEIEITGPFEDKFFYIGLLTPLDPAMTVRLKNT